MRSPLRIGRWGAPIQETQLWHCFFSASVRLGPHTGCHENAMPWIKLFENMEPENVQSKNCELQHIQKSSGFCGFCGYLIQILAKGIGIAAAPSRWLNCASQGNEDEIERPSHLTTASWQTLAWQKTNNEVQPH